MKKKPAKKKAAPKAKKAEIVKAAPKAIVMSKSEAQKLQAGIIEDFRAWERNVISAAVKLETFIRGQGWVALGYKNMTEWREKEIPFADFYNLRGVQKLSAAGVPAERIEKMPLTNINTLVRRLPPSEWKKETWQRDAENLPVADFTVKAKRESDEMGQHVEDLIHRGFTVPKSIADSYDLALRVAEAIDGCTRMDKRIEAICANYLNAPSEQQGKSKLQAYSALTEPEAVAVAD